MSKLKLGIRQFKGDCVEAKCKLTIKTDTNTYYYVIYVSKSKEFEQHWYFDYYQTIKDLYIEGEIKFIYAKAQKHLGDEYGIDVYWKWDREI